MNRESVDLHLEKVCKLLNIEENQLGTSKVDGEVLKEADEYLRKDKKQIGSDPPEGEKKVLARDRSEFENRKSPKQPLREKRESGKSARSMQKCHESLDRYLKHQQVLEQREKAQSILHGNKEEQLIAKPGEFVVVQTAEKSRPALWGARESLRSTSRRRGNTGSGTRRMLGLSGTRQKSTLEARPEDSGRGETIQTIWPSRGMISSRQYNRSATSLGGYMALRTKSQGFGQPQEHSEQKHVWPKAKIPPLNLEEAKQDGAQTARSGARNQPDLKEPKIRSSLTRSIRSIMQKQDTGMLIQSSRLLSGAVAGASRESETAMSSREAGRPMSSLQSHRPTEGIRKPADRDIQQILQAGGLPTSQNTARQPKPSRFIERVRQSARASQISDVGSSHTYRVPAAKNAAKIVKDAGMAQNLKQLKLPLLVKRQKDMVKGDEKYSPFLNEIQEKTKKDSDMNSQGHQLKRSGAGFLGLELFDSAGDYEDPESIIDEFRDPFDLKCFAQTKWLFSDGRDPEMRPCEVLEYLPERGLFRIKWRHNQVQKTVSRFNLVFDQEDKTRLEERIEKARKLRAEAEVITRYHYTIDKTQVKNLTPVPDEVKTRISFRILSLTPEVLRHTKRVIDPIDPMVAALTRVTWPDRQMNPLCLPENAVEQIHAAFRKNKLNFTTLGALFEELDLAYRRSARQSTFEAELPYKEEHRANFQSILPTQKFLPPSGRDRSDGPYYGVLRIDYRVEEFHTLAAKMAKKIQVGSPTKLRILQNARVHLEELSRQEFFVLKHRRHQRAKDFCRANRVKALELIAEIQTYMLDTQNELTAQLAQEASRIDQINTQRREARSHESEQWKEEVVKRRFTEDIRSLSVVLNLHYERGLRECFERSMASLTTFMARGESHLEESLGNPLSDEITCEEIEVIAHDAVLERRVTNELFMLEMTLVYSRAAGEVLLQPSPEELTTDLVGLAQDVADSLTAIACLQTPETGYSRQSEPAGRSKVFPECEVDLVGKAIEALRARILAVLKVPTAVAFQLNRHSSILSVDIKKYRDWLKEDAVGLPEYTAELERLAMAQQEVERLLFEPSLKLGPIVLHCSTLKSQILAKVADMNNQLFTRIKKAMIKTSKSIETEVEAIRRVLSNEKIRDIEQLTAIKDYVKRLPEARLKIRGIIKEVNGQMALLEKYQHELTKEEEKRMAKSEANPDEEPQSKYQWWVDQVKQTWSSFSEPLKIVDDEEDCRERVDQLEKVFCADLRTANETLAKDMEECKLALEMIQGYEALPDYDAVAARCDHLEETLETCSELAEISNRREGLFGQRLTDYGVIDKLKEEFLPYFQLWTLARDYFFKINVWMKGPLYDIERDELVKEVTEACRSLLKLGTADFKEHRAVALVASDLRKLYEGFRPYLPLISALRSPFLRPRHWTTILALKTPPLDINPDLNQTLEDLLAEGIMSLVEEINEIGHFAAREKKLEEQVTAMKDEWRHIKFDLVPFKDTDTHLLHKPEPIWELLDEHIQKTLAIAASPYVKFLQSEVNYWKQTLIRIQDVLEEWGKVQRGWLYLQPIFTSPDIQAQLPQVTAIFASVDKQWRNIMMGTMLSPLVLDACFQSRIMETFWSCNDSLERVEKGLADYLAQKRMAFPRFFFLPNDDLVQILSQARNPVQVQPYLNKIFEGISRVTFEEGKVTAMKSSLEELVSFRTSVPTEEIDEEGALVVRRIEGWLRDTEAEMRTSLREQIEEAREEQETRQRSEWLFAWPAQLVLALEQCRWTSVVEEGLEGQREDPRAPHRVLEQEELRLRELVALTGDPKTQETRHAETLGALIVLAVHTKDVTAELVRNGVSDVEEFEWTTHLRHYILYDIPPRGAAKQLELEARMVSASRRYGFEYLGNQPRLVITPLTDRCYRTLMVALQLNLGGAPEGPAGTGKTETTKDLAKALAKQCLVFNCSDQLEVETMGKFFRGLACCGAWACFDEFNRIEVEVLSVIASQILQIQTALMRKRPWAPFTFEGDTLPMDPTCAVFITMNPGYAGRSELPDNLKALFRPVAMMVPNYAMIAEISLYSYGFQCARELSEKITMGLRLASEQLSTQAHYDYGMRAVKSIILAAGRRKAESPDEDEAYLAYRSIAESSVPKLVSEDVPLFMAILSDLFPDTERRQPDYTGLLEALRVACKTRHLECEEEFSTKAIQLFQTQQVRHGLMLVGAALSGKSELMHSLAAALGVLNQDQPVVIEGVNPKAVTIGQLYGDFDPLTHEWSDGILARIVREGAADETQRKRWIVLDGPVDAVWVENLNTALDDNKKLCLPSGEIIKFTSRMTMIFEVEDLLEASPATVSRCGMVYLTPEKLGWEVQIQPWLEALPSSLRAEWRGGLLAALIEVLVPPALAWLLGDGGPARLVHPGVSANQLVKAFLSLLEALLLKDQTRETLAKKEQEEHDKREAKEAAEKLGSQQTGHIANRAGVATSTLSALSRQGQRGGEAARVKKQAKTEVINLFLMAAAWGFGALLSSTEAKLGLSELLIRHAGEQPEIAALASEDFAVPLPGMSLHDNYVDFEAGGWRRWEELLAGPAPDQDGPGGSLTRRTAGGATDSEAILIPTEDTLRFAFLTSQLIRREAPVCLLGATGTGKTSIVKEILDKAGETAGWSQGQLVLSATITTRGLQGFLESKLEKQRMGIYGPKGPAKKLVCFLDDLGMPAKEKYGAQPPLELTRALLTDGGLYDLKTTRRKRVVDVILAGAMSIPTGGRSFPTNRLLRHFNLLCLPELSTKTMQLVFRQILDRGLVHHDEAWRERTSSLTEMSVALYLHVSAALRPTPAKSHYQFNVRQLTELMQGLLMVSFSSVAEAARKSELLQKLWIHESRRVFTDRLVSEADRALVEGLLRSVVEGATHNFVDPRLLDIPPSQLMFCNFTHAESRDYSLVEGGRALRASVAAIIEQHNQAYSKSKLIGLELFTYLMEHLSRVSRILQKPRGHGLLVSLGGNGRASITKLATFINDGALFRIDASQAYGRNEWLDDLRTLYKAAGVEDQTQVLALTVAEAGACEGSFDDVSSIANSGEVPNLFAADDLDEISAEMGRLSKKLALSGALQVFAQRCRANVHVLLSMSPAGDDLREHLRRYPALANCMTIDWFLPWPEEALHAVAFAQLQDSAYLSSLGDSNAGAPRVAGGGKRHEEETAEGTGSQAAIMGPGLARDLAPLFVQIYLSVVSVAERYREERGRTVYLTPARLKEVFPLFDSMITEKAARVDLEREQYLTGIRKLDEAETNIDRLQERLVSLEPELKEKGLAVEAGLVALEKEGQEVEAAGEIVGGEAKVVAEQKAEAEGIEKECERRLADALPKYRKALVALRTLKDADFATMKRYNNPPAPVRLALEAACVMLGAKPRMVDKVVGKGGQKVKVPDYWEKSKKLLGEYKKFIASMEDYDKDNIPPERIAKIQGYLSDPEFVPERIREASEAAEGICKWVIAVAEYHEVAKEVKPLREALAVAQGKLRATEAEFATKEAALEAVREKRRALADEHEKMVAEKHELTRQRDQCLLKLGRAKQLMSSLGGERERWQSAAEALKEERAILMGDMVLAASAITYLGPFEASFRKALTDESWLGLLQNTTAVPSRTRSFDLREAVGDSDKMQQWELQGIPNDSVSYENMIILEATVASRWPVLIDPQEQALAFLREYLDHDYLNIKATSSKFKQQLEYALAKGATVLCQNVGQLDGPADFLTVLDKEVSTVAGADYIKFGDGQVEYHPDFRLLMLTSLENPHVSPRVQSKVQMLNFSTTQEALQEQLLSLVCKSECHKEEEEKHRLRRQDLEFRSQRTRIEREILQLLLETGEDVLEDDTLASSLDESKRITDDISHKLSSAAHLVQRIEDSRKAYRPVALHGARLFFAVQGLASLDPMYRFSMRWFRDLFIESLALGEGEKREPGARLRGAQLKRKFRAILFESVSMSLFGHHQLVFAFLISAKVHETVGGSSADNEEAQAFQKKLQQLDRVHQDKLEQQQEKTRSGITRLTAAKKLGTSSIGKSDTSNENSRARGSLMAQAQAIKDRQEEERLAVPTEQLSYLLTGLLPPGSEVEERPRPDSCAGFLDEKKWRRVLEIATFDCFETLPEELEQQPEIWTAFIEDKTQPKEGKQAPIPGVFGEAQFPEFSQILLKRILRPELVTEAIRGYVEHSLGPEFVRPMITNLTEVYDERSTASTPLLLLLTPGNDPMESISRLAGQKQKIPYPVSLGKGQAAKARSLLSEVRADGGWVVLQNCHLAPSFMAELAQVVDQLQPQAKTLRGEADVDRSSEQAGERRQKPTHPEFRLWLTSMSCDFFPAAILKSSIKLTSEPPQGIKSSLLRTYNLIANSKPDRELYQTSTKPGVWQPLFLSLAFFHAVVRERRKFGALGWNCRYDFNDSDLLISMRQLHLLVERSKATPLKALVYLTGECNYGGRVTDEQDRRTLTTLLRDFYCEQALCTSPLGTHNFSGASGLDLEQFKVLKLPDLESHLDFVKTLPSRESPLLVGLHPNATVHLALQQAESVLSLVLKASRASTSGSGSQGKADPNLLASQLLMVQALRSKIRGLFDVEAIRKQFPFRYEASVNVVLVQEAARYNRLLSTARNSLDALNLALRGEAVTTASLESTLDCIFCNTVPPSWSARAFPSLKPLSSWVEDLAARTQMLDEWNKQGSLPRLFWISGLFFPQSFLTAAKQDYARRFGYPIDRVDITAEIGPSDPDSEKLVAESNGNRIWVTGLHLQAARWSGEEQLLAEAPEGVSWQPLPPISLSPILSPGHSRHEKDHGVESLYTQHAQLADVPKRFECALYRTSARAGTLATTGHSTNFVMCVPLPTLSDPGHWVKRGAALLLATDD